MTIQLNRLTPLAMAAVAALAPLPTWGQAAQPASQSGTIVITGSLRGQAVLEAPYAISAVGREDLRSAGAMINLSEALARVPGLVVANRNNYAQDLQISSRGFGARAGFGVRGMRLYTDGIPASGPDGQGQVAHFDLAGAARVEVLRGPFSVLYGNSSGGVIALHSAPVQVAASELALDVGAAGLRQGRFTIATPLGDGVDVKASLSQLELDGFRPQSAARRTLGNVRLAWQGANDRITVLGSVHEQAAQDPLGLTAAQFAADPTQTTSQAAQFNTRKTIAQAQAGVSWRHAFADGSALRESTLTLYEGSRDVVQWLAIAAGTQANPRHGGGVIDFSRSYTGVEGRLLWQVVGADIATGISIDNQGDDRRGFENFTGTGAAQVLGVTGRLRRDEVNAARTRDAYVQAVLPLAAGWQATGGLRSGKVSMTASDKFLGNGDDSGQLDYSYTNPVLGLRWTVAPGWIVHASAARGFESPTLGELAYRPDGSAGFNTALRGQGSRQIELGAKWRSGGFEFDVAAFKVHTDDEIGVATNAGGRSSFRNVGRTQRYGAEFSTRWQISSAWRAQAALTALKARYTDGFLTCSAIPCAAAAVPVPAGNRIAGTQRGTAWAEVAWRPAASIGEFALEWRAVGRTAANDLNTESAAGYSVANLRWSKRWELVDFGGANNAGKSAIEALLRVDNVGDKAYAGSVIVNDANGRHYEAGAPRSLLLSLRWVQRW